MKLSFVAILITLSTMSAHAACICAQESRSYQDVECKWVNLEEDCRYVTKYDGTSYVAKVVLNSKEYNLERFDTRASCIAFLKTAPECK